MKKEIFKLVSTLVIYGGAVVVLGTAGASDLGQIGLTETIIRECIGAGLILGGYLGLVIGGFENVKIDGGN